MADKRDINAVDDLTETEEAPGWIVTYADLVTLLLVFFVLLYSISSLNLAKFRKAAGSIRQSLGTSMLTDDVMALMKIDDEAGKQLNIEGFDGFKTREEALLEQIRAFIREKGLEGRVRVTLESGKVSIQVTGTVLFSSGAAKLNTDSGPIMNRIVEILREYDEYQVNIKGHTDNIPISTPEFPSNWELSAIRATTVLKYLIRRGIDPERLTATGFGDLMPVVPNTSEANRARNRRVEFVLETKTTDF